MVVKRSINVDSPMQQRQPLVSGLGSVELLAIRGSGADGFVRAKIRIRDGENAGRVFFVKQPKTEEAYSEKDFTPAEIAQMRKADLERDSQLSTRALVVASLHEGRYRTLEPAPLSEPESFIRMGRYRKKR